MNTNKYLDELFDYSEFNKIENGLYYVSLTDEETREPQSPKGMLEVLRMLEFYKPLQDLEKNDKIEMVVDDRALIIKSKN